jgi:hypothetical protein
MSTKPPSKIKPVTGTLETLAYGSVADIPTAEPHDRDRLGYNVWRWLKYRRDSLEVAFRSAGAQLLVGEEEALNTVRARLREAGIALE